MKEGVGWVRKVVGGVGEGGMGWGEWVRMG